jgi:hypothetical protein
MNKVICIDSGVILHRSIFAWGSEKKRRLEQGNNEDPIPASYTYLNTCYSILKKIGIDKEDIIIIAQDSRNSWRKAFLEEYKGQRKELRDSHEHINWNLQYGLINKLERQLNDTTNWHFIKLEDIFNYADLALTDEGQRLKIEDYGNISYETEFGLESDDIQSICPKVFKDKEVILVTIDEDLSQNCYYKNCKIFNPNLKSPTNKAKNGFYKIIDDPLKIITKKIRTGDKSDNILIDKKKDTERDVEVRKFIIDLLNLPDFVEQPIIDALKELDYNKKVLYNQLPFQNSLAQKFDTIYDQKSIRTWEESVKRHKLKEEQRLKKQREKYKKKKQKIKL